MKLFFKKLYQFFPFILIFKLLRKIYIPPFYKYLTVKGSFSTKLENGENITLSINHSLYIEKEIFWNGIPCEFEPFTLELWCDLAKKSNVIFDIGANTGVFSILAKAYSKNSEIHAFEPIQYNTAILNKNISLNNYTKIFTNKIALSNSLGEATMFIKENEVNYMNSVNLNRYGNDKVKEIKVPLETLHNYIKKNNIKEINLMKIDVEGHEIEVLLGMKEYLEKFKPSIFIEVLNNDMAKALNKLFKDIKYEFYFIDDKLEELVSMPKIIAKERVNYLLKPSKY
ncbi:MAG: FkbM family methyltransferase [Flavobacteriales bacterium]|nr:FkbM family methyltransferase [Flavobacteriales bacterium]MCB9364761.1 FkbM family methyltransferase [Flavobacteriales bacterium]